MPIVSGITNRGTVWIKKLDRNGNLLQKRVAKNKIQYDTYFSKRDGRPKLFLKTNLSQNVQTAYKLPLRGFWGKLLPQKYNRLKIFDLKNSLYANHVRNVTGFNNKKFDAISENLFADYLETLEEFIM